ncbi:MAG: cytochrome c [bacterium]|mgnify:CR=1 FL=1
MRRSILYIRFLLMTAFLLGIVGCHDMEDQPSFKAQEGPRLSSPDESVPVQGKEVFVPGETLINPVPASEASVQRGKTLFEINCAMCHGKQGFGDGPVGKKFLPQPANLHEQRIQQMNDAEIFIRITSGFGTMPSFQRRITPQERWNLVNYLRGFKETSPKS